MLLTIAVGLLVYALVREVAGTALWQHYGDDLLYYTGRHLQLVAYSMALACLIGAPAGVLLSRPCLVRQAEYLMQIFNIGNTVPSLAVLALALGIFGIGDLPAVLALCLAALLPITRSTCDGLRHLSPALREAARGLGMTSRQTLLRVELPNAVPVMLAGVRTAFVINVGTAPLAYLIGADSLGTLIFPGIYLNKAPQLLLGASATALLALGCDGALLLAARLLAARRRLLPSITLLVTVTAALLAMPSAHAQTLRIGAKNFTEQYLLAEITRQYLSARGYQVEARTGLGSMLMRSALVNGQLDIVWDYTGTALLLYHHQKDRLDAAQAYARVRDLDAPHQLVWLDPAALNNTYALAMPGSIARALHVSTLSQLAALIARDPAGTPHRFAMDAEFAERADGLQPLMRYYGMPFSRSDIKQMDPGLVYTALRKQQVMLGLVYTTDGRVAGFDLQLLADDRGFFAAYHAVPVVRHAVLVAHPQLAAQLNALSHTLDNTAMQAMNRQVDIDGASVQSVARQFLRSVPLQ